MKRLAFVLFLLSGIAIVWLCNDLVSSLRGSGAGPALRREDIRLSYDGKSITYWEKQALIQMPQGNFEKAILPVVKKMGPEAVPFWLNRLQTKDSNATLFYAKLWASLPTLLRPVLPEPMPQRVRRNVAWQILDNLQFTNGIPELIQLSYSKDAELQRYALQLLWGRAYRFYRPSDKCVAAFCSALKAADQQTRLWAVHGLNILPLREEALPALQLALNDVDEEVRVNAAIAVTKLQPSYELTHVFQAGLTSSNPNVRVISEVALANLQRRQRASPSNSSP